MNASLKPALGRHLRGMHQLESKISDLQNQYQCLLKERQQDITNLLSAVDLVHLDDHLLSGGLLFLKEKTTSQDAANKSLVEAWRDAGEKFLRRRKFKSCSSESAGSYRWARHEDRKQAEIYSPPRRKQEEVPPQTSSKKITTSKQTATPETAPQPTQKSSREEEE